MDVRHLIQGYLEEDLGDGDITSQAVIPENLPGAASVVLRQRGFVVGLAEVCMVFEATGAKATPLIPESSWQEAGTELIEVTGPARAILAGERVALNLLGRMVGIASNTRVLMEQLAKDCSAAQVAATRKTTPGFRYFEKLAVTRAGGNPHRFDLSSEGMIKDNHRDAAGDLASAIKEFKKAYPNKILTVEVESQSDCLLAAKLGVEWVLIDNQSSETGLAWATKAWEIRPELKIEASGGISFAQVPQYGWADRISLGALTHQAQSIDVGLDWRIHD